MMFQIIGFMLFLLQLTNCMYSVQDEPFFACDPNKHIQSLSQECYEQMEIVCSHPVLVYNLWDATSRYLHSGISTHLNGDYGDFDLCMSIEHEENDTRIIGQYCPFSVYVPLPLITENDQGGSQFKVKYSALSFCIPSACTLDEAMLFSPLKPISEIQPIFECYTKETGTEYTASTYAVLIGVCIIVALMVISTIYDTFLYYSEKEPFHEIARAFSILHNGRQIVEVKTDKVKQVLCLNGMRALCMAWIILGHTANSWLFEPVTNRKAAEEMSRQIYIQYIRMAKYGVDTFFFISGFLFAFGYVKGVQGVSWIQQVKQVPILYLHRYLRITPAVAALYFIGPWLFPALPQGPLWYPLYSAQDKTCSAHWWRFFLYIQNYYPFSEACYGHTWYLSADMQLFIAAPLVLIPISIYAKKKFKTVIVCLVGLVLAMVVITIGLNFTNPEDVDAEYYTHSRAADYLLGIIGALLINEYKGKKIHISRVLNLTLWILSLVVIIGIVFSMHDLDVNKTDTKQVIFTEINRPIWCLCIMWVVFACYFGYGGFINWLLSRPILLIGSRLSYSMYIVHNTVVMYNESMSRNPTYCSHYMDYNQWTSNVVTSIIIGGIWTLAFERPMLLIDKFIIGGLTQKKTKPRSDFTDIRVEGNKKLEE